MIKLAQPFLLASTLLAVAACDVEDEPALELTVLDERALEGVHTSLDGQRMDFAITRTAAGPRATFEVEGEALLTIADGSLRVGEREIPTTDVEAVGLVLAELEQSAQGQQLGELSLELEAELGDELHSTIDGLLAPTDPAALKLSCIYYPIYDALNLGDACQTNCLQCNGCETALSSWSCFFATGPLCEFSCFDY